MAYPKKDQVKDALIRAKDMAETAETAAHWAMVAGEALFASRSAQDAEDVGPDVEEDPICIRMEVGGGDANHMAVQRATPDRDLNFLYVDAAEQTACTWVRPSEVEVYRRFPCVRFGTSCKMARAPETPPPAVPLSDDPDLQELLKAFSGVFRDLDEDTWALDFAHRLRLVAIQELYGWMAPHIPERETPANPGELERAGAIARAIARLAECLTEV